MPETAIGFGLTETDDGLILRHVSSNGETTEIKMSEQEFFSLKATIDLWKDRRMSEFQTRTGSAQPIVVHQVAQVGIWPDAIQENVLLTFETPSGTTVTFSLPMPVAGTLSDALPALLAQMRPTNPMKQ